MVSAASFQPIQPFQMNMEFSKYFLEHESDCWLFKIAQRISICTLIPFLLIASLEAVIKNLIIINFLNLSIGVINRIRELYHRYCLNP